MGLNGGVEASKRPRSAWRRAEKAVFHAQVTLKESLLGWTKTIRHMDGHSVEIGTDSVTKPFQVIKAILFTKS